MGGTRRPWKTKLTCKALALVIRSVPGKFVLSNCDDYKALREVGMNYIRDPVEGG